MTNQVKDVLAALEKAKCLEQEAQKFYGEAVDRTASAKGKEVFRALIKDEVMHERLIQRQIDVLAAEGKWDKLPGTQGAACDLSQEIFPRGREGLEKAVKADADDAEALLAGLEFESNSYDLYRREAQAATGSAVREMFEFLASQERLHFDLLMSNYEALVSLGRWAD
jgi:rubrerythrin